MKNLFDSTATTDIVNRLDLLKKEQQPLWGKMNAAQMVKHCQAPFEVYFGELKLKQSFVGILFGRIAKRQMLGDKPWKRSLPTAKEFVVSDQPEFENEKEKLVRQINRFANSAGVQHAPVHPFFGKMTADEWSTLAYRHLDHHLHQFGV